MSRVLRVRPTFLDDPTNLGNPQVGVYEGEFWWARVLRVWVQPVQLAGEDPPDGAGGGWKVDNAEWRPLYGRDCLVPADGKPFQRLQVSGCCVDVEIGDDPRERFPGPVVDVLNAWSWITTATFTFADGVQGPVTVIGEQYPFPTFDFDQLLVAGYSGITEATTLAYGAYDTLIPRSSGLQSYSAFATVPAKVINTPGRSRSLIDPHSAAGTDILVAPVGQWSLILPTCGGTGTVTLNIYGRR